LYFLFQDEECKTYIKSDLFQKDILTLLEHDQNAFDTPTGWNLKTIEESPLVFDFEKIWQTIKETYFSEMSQLSFSKMPEENEIKESFIQLINLSIKKL